MEPLPSKVAIIVANDKYADGLSYEPVHANLNDGKALLLKFQRHGFLTIPAFDVDLATYHNTLNTASHCMDDHVGLVVFYWCGHAYQRDGASRLVCVDGNPADLQDTIAKLQSWAPNALTLVVQDGCREEVHDSCEIQRCSGDPSDRSPLIILFACGPSRTASESDEHGHLTKAVLNHLFRDSRLTSILEDIKQDVRNSTCKMQCPQTHDNCPTQEILANPILYNPCCCSVRTHAREKLKERDDRIQDLQLQLQTERCSRTRSRSDSFSSQCYSHSPRKSLSQGQDRHWIVIDGNIGIGKTTVLESWSKKIDPDFDVIKEPIDDWKEDLENLSKNALGAQLKIWSHFNDIATRLCQSNRHIISERGPLSVTHVFNEHYKRKKLLSSKDTESFEKLRMALQQRRMLPTCYIFLEADAKTCHSRMTHRGRGFEKGNSVDDLQELEGLFKECYSNLERKRHERLPGGARVIRIDATCEQHVLLERFENEGMEVWKNLFKT